MYFWLASHFCGDLKSNHSKSKSGNFEDGMSNGQSLTMVVYIVPNHLKTGPFEIWTISKLTSFCTFKIRTCQDFRCPLILNIFWTDYSIHFVLSQYAVTHAFSGEILYFISRILSFSSGPIFPTILLILQSSVIRWFVMQRVLMISSKMLKYNCPLFHSKIGK